MHRRHAPTEKRSGRRAARAVEADRGGVQGEDPRSTGGAVLARVLQTPGSGLLASGQVHPAVETAIGRARGGGTSLDTGARTRIEPLVGDSLGDVRVHNGPDADALARSVEARAFTTGRDVFFARGEYRPGTADGDRLLAHELAHVVQQRGAAASGPLTVTDPGDASEREAERASHGLGS